MENSVFERIAKRYDSEERIELAKIIVKEARKRIYPKVNQNL